MIDILFCLLIVTCYLIGGQIQKGVRRFGAPSFAFIYVQIRDKSKEAKQRLFYIWLLCLMGILSMGYGESSFLRKVFKSDWSTRVVYSALIAGIFCLAGYGWIKYLCFPVLIAAFQVRAGKLFSIGKFDILIEDICRALAIFICAMITVKSRGFIL